MKIAKSVNRLGTEAVYNIFAETKKLTQQGKKIIDLSLGQSDFKSPNHVVEATIQALKERGHNVKYRGSIGEANCIEIKNDWIFGAADSRRNSNARGY